MSQDFEKSFVPRLMHQSKVLVLFLSQEGDNGHEHPVVYWSWKLLPHEQRYSTIEECLAIKLGVNAF